MNDFDFRFFHLHIPDLADQEFLVAKLRRVTSPPVQVGTVSNSIASSFGRLADIIRLGKQCRNFADLRRIEWLLKERLHTDSDAEWANYEEVICRGLGVERLEPIVPRNLRPATRSAVTFHEAMMNDVPYVVAKVGPILGSPAALYLTHPHEIESAFARLRDIFRIGATGQICRDFAEYGRKIGKTGGEIVREWQEFERGVALGEASPHLPFRWLGTPERLLMGCED